MNNLKSAERIGEVIESSNNSVYIEARNFRDPPRLAELVKIPYKTGTGEEIIALGLITQTRTTSKDDRIPVALGLDQETLEKEQPQIFELLRSLCEVLIIGSLEEDTYYEICPPVLPSLHSFVYLMTDEEKEMILTQSLVLEKILLEFSRNSSLDDVLLLFLRTRVGMLAGDKQREFKRQIGKKIALYLSNDSVRMNFLLRRLERI